MRLYLMRHSFAIDPRQTDVPDEHRPLTPEGASLVRRAAHGLRHLEVSPDVVLTSPFIRAVQTAEITAKILGIPQSNLHRTASLLAEQPPLELLDELERLGVESVLCVGHAPNLDMVIAHTCGSRDEPITSLRKGSVICLEVESDLPVAWLVWLLEAPMLARLGE